MNFYVEQKVLDSGVKIVFPVVRGLDNHVESEEWKAYRTERIAALLEAYRDLDVKADPILEGFNVLHDNTGVKRRKNIPASENLIKLLKKHEDMFYINLAVDIYNLISLESKLALGAHDIDHVDGGTSRCASPTERSGSSPSASRSPSASTPASTATAMTPTKSSAVWKSARWRRPRSRKRRRTSSILSRATRLRRMSSCLRRRRPLSTRP